MRWKSKWNGHDMKLNERKWNEIKWKLKWEFKLDQREDLNYDEVHLKINNSFGGYGWLVGGYEVYFITALWQMKKL